MGIVSVAGIVGSAGVSLSFGIDAILKSVKGDDNSHT